MKRVKRKIKEEVLSKSTDVTDVVKTVEEFDSNDNLIHKVEYYHSGELASEETHEYEENILVKSCVSQPMIMMEEMVVFEYDENTRRMKEMYFENEEQVMIKSIEYDDQDVREVLTDMNGQVINEVFKNDSDKTVEERNYDHNGVLALTVVKHYVDDKVVRTVVDDSREWHYTYDQRGNLTKLQGVEHEEVGFEEEYFYDESDNQIGSIGRDQHTNEKIRIERMFSASGKLVEARTFRDEVVEKVEKAEYNEHDLIVRFVREGDESKETIVTYDYVE